MLSTSAAFLSSASVSSSVFLLLPVYGTRYTDEGIDGDKGADKEMHGMHAMYAVLGIALAPPKDHACRRKAAPQSSVGAHDAYNHTGEHD